MNRLLFPVLVILIISTAISISANEFPTVPTDHWAYDSMKNLADHGIVKGYFKGPKTRYEFAEILEKSFDGALDHQWKYETGDPGRLVPADGKQTPVLLPEDIAALKKLLNEFKDELSALGADVESYRRKIAEMNNSFPRSPENPGLRITGVFPVAPYAGPGITINSHINFDPRNNSYDKRTDTSSSINPRWVNIGFTTMNKCSTDVWRYGYKESVDGRPVGAFHPGPVHEYISGLNSAVRWISPITGLIDVRWIYDSATCGTGHKAVFHNNFRIWEINAPKGIYSLDNIPVKVGDTIDFTVWSESSKGMIR